MAAVGVILAFGSLLYLSVKGVRLHIVMFISTVIMAITSGLPITEMLPVFWRSFSERTTLELAGAVLSIGIFSTVMQRSGFLDRTVSGLTVFLGNVKAAILTVPALVGTMPVLGGAALSAPLVDKLGEPLGLTPDAKAAANLVFRHGMFFVFPFSTSLILMSNLTGFTVSQLIAKMWPMSLVLWGIGYLALLRKTPLSGRTSAGVAADQVSATASDDCARSGNGSAGCGPCEDDGSAGSIDSALGGQRETTFSPVGPATAPTGRVAGLAEFLLYGGPLLLALALGIALKLPLWLALTIGTSTAAALAIRMKRPLPSRADLVEGANLGQVAAMFWIMAFKSFVELTPVFRSLVDKATANGISPALLAVLLPLAFGYANASQTATISVLVPILVPTAGSEALRLGFTALIYSGSFTSYFFSPLHMCQVLTCQYYGVEILQVYKRNWPVFVGFLGILGYFYLTILRA